MAFDIREYLEKNKIELGKYETTEAHNVTKGISDIRKTMYEVHIKDGKFQLDTLKKIIVEGKEQIFEGTSYPSQDEAESLVDWTNHMNQVYVGGSSLVRKEFNKADDIRQKMWNKIFGDKSPWTAERKNNKLSVVWDKSKSEKLGV